MYRALDPVKIVATAAKLEARIGDRFPGSGLSSVAHELVAVARATQARVEALERSHVGLRLLSALVLTAGLAGIAVVVAQLKIEGASMELFGLMQGIDAGVNLVLVVGAAVFFLVTLEARSKRARSLGHLYELRAIIHVIDMHQLTKDPSAVVAGGPATPHSPPRSMTPFELTRYLDYCSEMLSLAAKVAALYAQSSTDAQVIGTVNDLEQLTSNLSAKVWQKITLVQTLPPGAA